MKSRISERDHYKGIRRNKTMLKIKREWKQSKCDFENDT